MSPSGNFRCQLFDHFSRVRLVKMRIFTSGPQAGMAHLPFCEIWWSTILLQMAYSTVTERVHTATFNLETVADWIERVSKYIVVG